MDFRESIAGRVVLMVMVATIGGTAAILLVTAEARARNLSNHDHDNTTQPANDDPDNKGNEIVDLDASVVGVRKSRQISVEAHSSSQQFINTKDTSGKGPDSLLDGVLAVLRRHLLEYPYPVDGTHNRGNKVVEELQNNNRENEEVPVPHRIRHRASKRRRRRFGPQQEQGDQLESVNSLDNLVIMNDERDPFWRRRTELHQGSLDLQNHENDFALINGTAEENKVLRISGDPNDQISTANHSGVSSHQWLVVAMVGWSLVGMLLIVLACIAFCYNTTARTESHLRNFQEYIDQQPLLIYDPEGHQGDDEDTYKNDELESKNSDKKYHLPFQMNTDVKKVGFPPLHWLLSNLPPRDHDKTEVDYLDDSCLLDDDHLLDYNDSDSHTSHDFLLNSDGPLKCNSELAIHSASLPRRSLSLTDLTV